MTEFCCYNSNHSIRQLSGLNDMKEEFESLLALEEEFEKSDLSHLNIKYIDHQAMLKRVTYFWILGSDDADYKRMEFFCESSMEKWYKSRFIKPIENTQGEKRYYSEEKTKEQILEIPGLLDYELTRAFELELHLKEYERKLRRRLKRIYKLSNACSTTNF